MRDEADASAWVDDVSLIEVPLMATLGSEIVNVSRVGDYAIPLQLTNLTSHLLELEFKMDGLPEGMSLDFGETVALEAEQTMDMEGNLHVSEIASEQPYQVNLQIYSNGKEITTLPMTIDVNRNLVRNPGFEDGNQNYGPGGWHMVGLEKWTQEETHSGQYAVAIDPEAYPSLLYSSPIPVEQWKTYRMSAWVKNDASTGTLSVGVREINAQGSSIRYIWEQTTPLSEWTIYSIEFPPTEQTKHVGLYFQATEKDGESIDGTGWVDDFRLEEVEN